MKHTVGGIQEKLALCPGEKWRICVALELECEMLHAMADLLIITTQDPVCIEKKETKLCGLTESQRCEKRQVNSAEVSQPMAWEALLVSLEAGCLWDMSLCGTVVSPSVSFYFPGRETSAPGKKPVLPLSFRAWSRTLVLRRLLWLLSLKD